MSEVAPLEAQAGRGPSRSFTPVNRPVVLRKCACGGTPGPDGECENCKRRRLLVQRVATGAAAAGPSAPESVHRTLASPGRPLDPGTRQFMESRFGHDFSQVRIHTDSHAADSAREINAQAYTAGNDIAFAPGKYQPDSHAGQHLLAHELAHTVQQGGLQRRASDLAVDTEPGSRLEHEADRAAHSVMNGRGAPAIAGRVAGPVVSRAPVSAPATGTAAGGTPVPVPVSTPSYFGNTTHQVTAEAGVSVGTGTAATAEESFSVDVLYVPAAKGRKGVQRFKDLANGGVLQSVIGLSGNANASAWQLRDPPPELRSTWLSARGLAPGPAADKAWSDAGGGATFGVCATGNAQIDHIVELQTTGGNNAENLQPLDGSQNSESGQALWNEVSGLARAILAERKLSSGKAAQLRLKFRTADMKGTAKFPAYETAAPVLDPATKLKRGTTCLSIGEAMTDNLAAGAGTAPAGGSATTAYVITAKAAAATAGGSSTTLRVPGSLPLAADAAIYSDPANQAAGQLISGLLLEKLKSGSNASAGKIDASLDTRSRGPKATKLPISMDGAASVIGLDVAAQAQGGRLSLTNPNPGLKFTYPFLSPGVISTMEVTPAGETNWTGYIDPKISFLGRLDVASQNGTLTISKGLGLTELKPPIPGIRIVKSSLGLQLAPEFKPTGFLDLEFGPADKPTATASFAATTDGKGLVATGQLKLNIPGLSKAGAEITYRGGGDYGAGSWSGEFAIGMNDISLPYVTSGSVVARLGAGGKALTVSGALGLTLPGGSTATVGLSDQSGDWVLSGSGTFVVPKVGQVPGGITYNTRSGEVSARIGRVTFKLFGFPATLNSLKGKFASGVPPVFSGSGSLVISKGKLSGTINVDLGEDGRFSGSGTMAYPLFEGLTPQVTVIYKNDRLRVEADITVQSFKLFEGVKNDKELLNLSATIPVPGLSAGTSGVVITIGGGLTVGYSFGPGAIAPITFKAGFNPLDESPDLTLGVEGKLSIPARAYVTAAARAELGVQVDALIVKGGVGAGLELTGNIELSGEVFGTLTAAYKARRFTATMVAGLRAELVLGLALTAYLRAYASSLVPGLGAEQRWDWKLAQASFPTGLQFELSAPFAYDSAGSPAFKPPGLNDVTFIKPNIDPKALIQKVWARAPGQQSPAKG